MALDDIDALLIALELESFASGNSLEGVGEPGVYNEIKDETFQFR